MLADANRNGPPPDTSCVPGGASCSDCHSSGPPPTGSLRLTVPSRYAPGGAALHLYVRLDDPWANLAGFAVTAIDSGVPPAQVGTFTIVDGQNTQIVSGARNSVAHTGTGSALREWRFDWTPPALSAGTVGFHAGAVAADGDGTSGGDRTYCASVTLTPDNGCWIQAATDVSALSVCQGQNATVDGGRTFSNSCQDLVFEWFVDSNLFATGPVLSGLDVLTPGLHTADLTVYCETDPVNCSSVLDPPVTVEILPAPDSVDTGGPYTGMVSSWFPVDRADVQGAGPFSYLWTTESATGFFSPADRLVTQYMDSMVGSYRISLVVSDLVSGCSREAETRVRVASTGCPVPPGMIKPVLVAKDTSGDPNSIVFHWPRDPAAAGGYRCYRVASEVDLKIARAPWAVPPVCQTGDVDTLTCVFHNALLFEGTFFFNVVGACSDGTEGP